MNAPSGFWPELQSGGRKIGYARVSTKDQKLDMQIDALEAVKCDQIFTDHGVSGANANRPGLNAAVKALKPGDVLVVFKLCRLGRSVLHLSDLITRLHNQNIHFCSMSEGLNTTTYGGKLVFHIFASIAEFQRDLIRENTIHGMEAARQRGKRIGRPPKLDEYATLGAHELIMQHGLTLTETARRYSVSSSTVTRAFERFGLGAA